ncbi:MAG: isochorismatase family cysteine hydrolase [Solirubrobacteraceae bacterium]
MSCALIVTDMLNRYEHEDAEALLESVQAVVPRLASLIAEAREREMLVTYVNDNHGDWTAGRDALARSAMDGAAPSMVEPLLPPPDLPFIVKARHSIFYGTQLEYMLRQHDVTRLVLTGQVTEQCILYSALDAYVRHFEVVVPRDTVAHIHPDLGSAALQMMRVNMRAQTPCCDEALAVASGEALR